MYCVQNFQSFVSLQYHAIEHTPVAYSDSTVSAAVFDMYIVRIDKFTNPVATFAFQICQSASSDRHKEFSSTSDHRALTNKNSASPFLLIADRSGGALFVSAVVAAALMLMLIPRGPVWLTGTLSFEVGE